MLALIYQLQLIGVASELNDSIFGGTYRTYELDTAQFWVSVAGGVGIILMNLSVIAGRGPWRWTRQPDERGEAEAAPPEGEM
ncbi:MAG: hypothetical protein DCC58_20185 [Chloroflexi bacterium]|nr:MAG: hypothetical protein DCC58_20185 [Chloroflexota bacterium]